MKERERLPELLVPAGGREQLESAILYGADAVYMGGPELSLRTACEGFSGEELGLAVADAHTAGVRVYYCLNAMPYDAQLPAVEAVLERLPGMGVDGLIAADPGVIWLAKKHCPSVPLHLSTQAHSVNGAAVAFWREAGVERINLARELGFGISASQGVYSSDSTPFADKGVPAVSFARIAPPNTATIHNRYDTMALMKGEQMVLDTDFLIAFAERMANAARCPVAREMPENMKEKLDIYLCRKRAPKQ